MSVKEWGEAHRREALRRTYEIVAELSDPNDQRNGGLWMASNAFANVFDEGAWRTLLRGSLVSATRIDREVRRVRALAEGRMVRETVVRFYVSQPGMIDDDFGTLGGAKLAASQRVGARAVRARVARIRKA